MNSVSGGVAEWFKAPVLKTVVGRPTVSSNLTPSAIGVRPSIRSGVRFTSANPAAIMRRDLSTTRTGHFAVAGYPTARCRIRIPDAAQRYWVPVAQQGVRVEDAQLVLEGRTSWVYVFVAQLDRAQLS